MENEKLFRYIADGAGIFSVVAILLLLYIVVCQVFFNHDGHTEKVFGKKESQKPGKYTPIIMPVAIGLVMMLVNIIITQNMFAGNYTVARGGLMSMFVKNSVITDTGNIMLSLLSILFITLGSMIYDKIGGVKFSTLFCLNISLSLMVLPYTYSLVALIFAVGYWAFRKKEYLLLAITVVAGIAVHFPVDKFNFPLGEVFMLAYLLLIPVMAKLDNTKFKWLTAILGIVCGFFTVASRLIYQFI